MTKPTKSNTHQVEFSGWRYPQSKWTSWVNNMQSKYISIWNQAGINQAIVNSTHYKIPRHNNLLFAFAHKWSPSTNTFMFPWGEVTITLQDIFVLGGFSVLGHNVHDEDRVVVDDDLIHKLLEARSKISRSKSKNASIYEWLNLFIDSGSEIEHQAFLALWLSRFVFPSHSRDTIDKGVFPIAVRLAKGIKLALAPPVLASIYRDLRLLKHNASGSAESSAPLPPRKLIICAPLQLLQIWVWERFPSLTPTTPNSIKFGDPRFARWNNVKKVKDENVFALVERAGNEFKWCPYANESHSPLCKVYGDKERHLPVESGLDELFESFARCLRISQLVGIGNYIEHYFPHRVKMQFGIDQDVPAHVTPNTKITPEAAWEKYTRPIQQEKLYIPSRFSKPKVSDGYLIWWRQSSFGEKNGTAAGGIEKDSTRKSSRIKMEEDSSKVKKADTDLIVPPGFPPIVPPGFPPKCSSAGTSDKEDKLTLTALFKNMKTDNHAQSEGCDQLQSPLPSSSAVNENTRSSSSAMFVESESKTKVPADTDKKTEDVVWIDSDVEEGSCSAPMINETPQLELDARISWIEKATEAIKRAKLDYSEKCINRHYYCQCPAI